MKNRLSGRIFRYSAAIFVAGLLLFLLLFLLVYNGYYGKIPSETALNAIRHQESTKIFTSDGELIGRYFLEDRSSVGLEQVSPHVINCLIAIEDKRFYDHNGIDFRSLGRVLIKSLLLRDANSGGGSTITQQLAKNLFPRVSHKYLYYMINKLREMIIATKLEKIYTKEEILSLYLNTVSFGQDIYGIQAASERIFSKSAANLEIQEAATLIGMLKASTYFNPLLNPEKSLERRNFILNELVKANYLSAKEFELVKVLPLGTNPSSVRKRNSLYFLQSVEKEAQSILEGIDPEISFKTAGLTVYTTLNSKMQSYAEESMTQHLKYLQEIINREINESFWDRHQLIIDLERKKVNSENSDSDKQREMNVFDWEGDKTVSLTTLDSIKYYLKFLQGGLLAMDPTDGSIKAWVGGLDPVHFPTDHVLSKRQVGSTFKPFIYASALENNISPCDYFETAVVSYEVDGEDWNPRNSGIIEDEELTMATALEKSVNTVTVKILQESGIQNAINVARRAGIKSEIPAVPSMALGTASISLKEMVESYGIFANKGWNTPAVLIQKIEDRNGVVLFEYKSPPKNQVLSEETGLLMTHFLKEVVNSGTGYELRSRYGINNEVGGKTGTTQNNSDGWFIGISPKLIVGVWVGGEYPAISFNSSTYGQGARMALPIYGKLYQKMNANKGMDYITQARFPELPPHLKNQIDCDPIREEFRFWEWLKGLRKGKHKKGDIIESDSINSKPKLLDRIKGIFKKKDRSKG